MAKADVLTLVSDLSYGQADTPSIDDYYDHLMDQLARAPWLVTAGLIAVVKGTSQYALSATQSKLIAVFYDDRQLDRLTSLEAAALNPQWRDEVGTPLAYVVEDEAAKTFRLYPNPDRASKPFSFVFGEPLGRDFPIYAVCVFHTDIRQNVPAWLEPAVAFDVLAREYARESNHRDDAFAGMAKRVADLFYALVA